MNQSSKSIDGVRNNSFNDLQISNPIILNFIFDDELRNLSDDELQYDNQDIFYIDENTRCCTTFQNSINFNISNGSSYNFPISSFTISNICVMPRNRNTNI